MIGFVESIKLRKANLDKLQKGLDQQYKQVMLDGIQPLFEDYPNLKSISFAGESEYDDEIYSYNADLYNLRVGWLDSNVTQLQDEFVEKHFRDIVSLFSNKLEDLFGYSTVTFYKDTIETYG